MNEYAEYFALIRENDFEGAKAYLAVNPAAANAGQYGRTRRVARHADRGR